MNKNTIVGIAIVVILLLGGFLLLGRSGQPTTEELNTETEETAQVDKVATPRYATPNGVVLEFMNELYQAAPPKSDEGALATMASMLSPTAKQTASGQEGNFNPALFMGIQDIPDLGFEIINVSYGDNLATAQTNGIAEVTVKMKYSGGSETEKVFVLSEVGGYWLIDGISA